MNQTSKIVLKNITTLIAGRSSKLGSTLSQHLIKNGGTIYSVDQKIPSNLNLQKEQFVQGNLTGEGFLKGYLQQIGSVDAFVNCAAVRKCKQFQYCAEN